MTSKAAMAANYGGAGTAVAFGLTGTEWGVIFSGVGACCAIGGFWIQYLKYRALQRRLNREAQISEDYEDASH